jgi:hypothetical protein
MVVMVIGNGKSPKGHCPVHTASSIPTLPTYTHRVLANHSQTPRSYIVEKHSQIHDGNVYRERERETLEGTAPAGYKRSVFRAGSGS